MELRHLRYFLAVAETGSVTRAAEQLGIQQPPLSQQLKALETELGVTLFERQPRGVALTPAGTALLDDARDLFARIERMRTRMQRMARGDEGALAIGFTSSAAAHKLTPEVLRACRRQFPRVTLSLSERNAAEAIEQLADGKLSAAFVRAPVQFPDGVQFDLLLEEELVIALPLDHPLLRKRNAAGAAATTPVSLRELANDPFILVRRPGAPGMYGDLLRECEAQGFTPHIGAEVERMLTNLNLVAAGAGVSVVPASMAGLNRHGVAYCRMAEADRLRAPLTLAYRSADQDPALAALVALTHRIAARHRKRGEDATG
ncbi:LysR family transcriptional regulator [Cupriavidus plantarum]|uniref:LysR family transcriptional regulator n=1 Tax=Cupriavidus plantarum TaxID=942865 RepID=UPI001B11F397|nr:LysR family transcriptional regulator [Cupriavidus plantarum]CAG2134030.1 HTH-type transcriptional regulator BenM [Cupriavidus plantarum]SMR84317.1 transcriptional regulator, LysR family [Cupriavidus plantarum]